MPVVASALWYFHSSMWSSFCLQPQGTHVFIPSMLSHYPFLSSPFLHFFLLFLFLLPDLFFLLSLKLYFFPKCLLWIQNYVNRQPETLWMHIPSQSSPAFPACFIHSVPQYQTQRLVLIKHLMNTLSWISSSLLALYIAKSHLKTFQ